MSKRYHDQRAQEHSDGEMMSSGGGEHANMPQSVVMRDWASSHNYMSEGLNDGKSGIDAQVGEDEGQAHRHLKPKKV